MRIKKLQLRKNRIGGKEPLEETKHYEDLAKHFNGGIMGVPTSPPEITELLNTKYKNT